MKRLIMQFIGIVVMIAVLFGVIRIVYLGKEEISVQAETEAASGEEPQNKPNEAQTGYDKAEILYVIDGDTVDVSLNGKDVRVRLIGINTPESVSKEEGKNTAEGAKASEYVKSLLPKGTAVYLEYDKERQDEYDRTLAYLWTTDQADTASFDDFCKYNVGAVIMQNTYCEALYVRPNGKYYDWYKQLEKP